MGDRVLEIMKGGRIPIAIAGIDEVRLLDLLGTGGFGSVWKVSDTKTNKVYALKIIQGVEPGSVLADRVRLEAEVTIPSEHVIPSIGLREWDEQTFLILMEFFSGKSLERLLEEKALSDEIKLRVFPQILQGVADAHRCNIIHRDLKPSNILVDVKGDVRLIDFGLAKFKEKNLTGAGVAFGTLPYIAPEIFIRGAMYADARADIYALGHILYELAMGMHFWKKQGWRKLEDFANFLSATPPPTEAIDLDEFSCTFHPNAALSIASMVKVDPEHRCASVEDIIAALGGERYEVMMPADLNLRFPFLIVESGSNRGARTLVNLTDGDTCVMGRVDLAGNDESISRKHLEFSRKGDRYFVCDLGSKNGTLVGGIALEHDRKGAVPIQHDDRIKVGDIFLRFVMLRDI